SVNHSLMRLEERNQTGHLWTIDIECRSAVRGNLTIGSHLRTEERVRKECREKKCSVLNLFVAKSYCIRNTQAARDMPAQPHSSLVRFGRNSRHEVRMDEIVDLDLFVAE